MNAVERLLAQGEQLLSLYDEMYRERLGSGRDPTLPDVPQGLMREVGGTATYAIPSGQYWVSGHWLQASAEAAWLELKELKKQPTREQLAARTADLFREYLAQREQRCHMAEAARGCGLRIPRLGAAVHKDGRIG